jgi:2'-5' RNA ligase
VSAGEAPAAAGVRSRDQRARLFVALDLPEDARRALAAWRDPLLAGRDALRGVRPEMLHVTLCFLGSHPVAEIDAIAAACADGERPASGFALGITGAVWLPRRRPNVLAVTLTNEDERLGAFQAALAARLQAGGWYPPEDRRFLAHVTVARVRSRTRLRPFELPAPPELAMTASTFTLYRSRTESSGARYEALATFGLRS